MRQRFNFEHFPEEQEIIDDATAALRLQLEGGAGSEIATAVIERMIEQSRKEYDEEEFNMCLKADTEGMKLLSRLQDPDYSLSKMTEEEREILSILWINYMCEQPYGDIFNSMYKMVVHGMDYRRKGLEIIHRLQGEQEIDEAIYNGTIIYLWTMINVVRSIRRSMAGVFEMPAPHLYNGISMN